MTPRSGRRECQVPFRSWLHSGTIRRRTITMEKGFTDEEAEAPPRGVDAVASHEPRQSRIVVIEPVVEGRSFDPALGQFANKNERKGIQPMKKLILLLALICSAPASA